MYLFSRMMVWLARSRHSRGMGVQSPSAYRFIRYVVNEHYPYYAYEDLGSMPFSISKRRIKLCRFYFRLSNFCQPSVIFNYGSRTEAYEVYMKRGCMKAVVLNQQHGQPDILRTIDKLDMARISLVGNYPAVVNDAISKAHSQSVFVVEHIKRNKETWKYWQSLVQDSRVAVTYDLYYCGVLFFDKNIFKQNYIVNF